MVKSLLVVTLGLALAGCVGGGGSPCIPPETSVAVARSAGSGSCPAAVVTAAEAVPQMITLAKGASCGVTHFSITTGFNEPGTTTCMGSDAIAFQDLGSDGGTGTDTMAITCSDSTSCTETFAVTFTPQ